MWYADVDQQEPTPITEQICETILPSTNELGETNNINKMTKKEDIITFLSHAMWNPVPQSWIKVIDAGFSTSWTGLTSILVRQYLDESPENEKGHQRISQKNVRSTKPRNPLACNIMTARKNEIYINTVMLNGKVCSNQTGRFPVALSIRNKYAMVVYYHESNAILAEPLKTKYVDKQLNTIEKFHTFLLE